MDGSVSRLLSMIFQTLQRIFTTEGPTDMILSSNATTDTRLFFYNSYSETLTSLLEG